MAVKTKTFLIIISIVVFLGIGFYVWNYFTGRFSIGADTIMGCQNSSLVTGFMGKPGTNLMTYNLFGIDVTINERIAGSLDAIQREVVAAKTGYSFDDIQTYNYRRKTGGGGLSLHSWGIAIDINPTRNPYQPRNNGEMQTDIPPKIIEIFNKYGFQWGGDWVGQRDPMHFEWYGSGINGSTVDATSGQKIISDVAIAIDGLATVWSNGSYNAVLPATHAHKIVTTARGYENAVSDFETSCFKNQTMDIALKPLDTNLSGSISGQVLVNGSKPLFPAIIYLDGKMATNTNVNGEYSISNVRSGKHKVGAKLLFSPDVTVSTHKMVPGEDFKNINIEIGD